jgi:hypothetical protein
MTCPTKGRHASGSILDEREVICEVGSSHERALVLAMRLSISMRKTKTDRKKQRKKRQKIQKGKDKEAKEAKSKEEKGQKGEGVV